MKLNENDTKRYKERVIKKDDNECWSWSGTLNWRNYGQFTGEGRKTIRANRYSWLLHKGPIPDGLNVLHKCDNPTCTNPEHLFLGTQKDNVRDMIKKNRHYNLKGTKHGMAKLTEEKVIEIRKKRIETGAKYRDLAKEYGVCLRTMAMILTGKIWKHVKIIQIGA